MTYCRIRIEKNRTFVIELSHEGKTWMQKANSFEEAREFEIDYYLEMTPTERLELVQLLREEHFRLSGKFKDESSKRQKRLLGGGRIRLIWSSFMQ